METHHTLHASRDFTGYVPSWMVIQTSRHLGLEAHRNAPPQQAQASSSAGGPTNTCKGGEGSFSKNGLGLMKTKNATHEIESYCHIKLNAASFPKKRPTCFSPPPQNPPKTYQQKLFFFEKSLGRYLAGRLGNSV